MNSAGVVQWNIDGAPLGPAADTQWWPAIAADGSGGAIVTWFDSPNSLVYAQHVLATGVDPAWPAEGRGLCTAASTQQYPTIVTDGSGGAIVAWQDGRQDKINVHKNEVFAQRIYGSGEVAAVTPRVPAYFAVHAPHPNPAHAAATISFDLPSPQRIAVGVYDVTGRLVRTLAGGADIFLSAAIDLSALNSW